MKLLLKKCPICYDWFSPFRSHCPNCGAAEIAENVHVDAGCYSRPGILIASGLNRYYFNRNALEIARELSR